MDLSLLAEAGLLDNLTTTTTATTITTATSNNSSSATAANEETVTIITNFHPRCIFSRPTLNEFMSCEKQIWVAVRNRLISLFLSKESHRPGGGVILVPDPRLRTNMALRNQAFHLHTESMYHLPASVGDYTDFYSSREHATNVGIMFRGKEHALQPNWLHMPIGYHGRCSSVYPSVACGGGVLLMQGSSSISGVEDDDDHRIRMSSIRRPCGQIQLDPLDPSKGSTYGPSKLLDFELEVAFFVGGSTNHDDDFYGNNGDSMSKDGGECGSRGVVDENSRGRPLTLQQAKDRIFGYVLMNDWSARDIQKWEYVPLGPFTSKNFATTISTWVVTPMALEPHRCETSAGKTQGGSEVGGKGGDPTPLEYLRDDEYGMCAYYWTFLSTNDIEDLKCYYCLIISTNFRRSLKMYTGSYDVNLSVSLQPNGSSSTSSNSTQICQSNLKNLYWSSAQQLVHHSVTGCPMKAGDLLASGTISGSEPNSFGSMLELSWNGTRDIALQNGEVRKFLEDGDVVVIEGSCAAKEGWGRVGFGQCSGRVLPAIPYPYNDSRYVKEEPMEVVKEEKQQKQNGGEEEEEVMVNQPKSKFINFELMGFFRSMCTWRVRIALFAKGIKYEMRFQDPRDYHGVPMNSAPFLDFVDSETYATVRITQCLAIIEFLESAYPNQGVPLLPSEPIARAKAKEVAEIVLSRTVPFQSMTRVDCLDTVDMEDADDEENYYFAQKNVLFALKKLEDTLAPFHTLSDEANAKPAVETASTIGGPYAIGTHGPTLADICLMTQLYDARRLKIDLKDYHTLSTLKKIQDACASHPWFGNATYPGYSMESEDFEEFWRR